MKERIIEKMSFLIYLVWLVSVVFAALIIFRLAQIASVHRLVIDLDSVFALLL
jgi:hypothetical protein